MSQPERAPDSQRERVIDGQALALVERLAQLDLMDLADCNTAVRIIADALRAAHEGDGYEGIANDLVRELADARERIAALERLADELRILLVESEARGETHRWKGEQAEALREALAKYGADHIEGGCTKWRGHEHAGITSWEWLKDQPCTCGLTELLAPTAGRSAS